LTDEAGFTPAESLEEGEAGARTPMKKAGKAGATGAAGGK
jgi:hypothetical protein